MVEAEEPRVQRLAGERGDGGLRLRLQRSAAAHRTAAAVDRVADDRVPPLSQVNTNLMGSSGREAAVDQRRHSLIFAEHLVARRRRLAAVLEHRHLLAIARAATDIAGDLA